MRPMAQRTKVVASLDMDVEALPTGTASPFRNATAAAADAAVT